jgi:hypothetical protein
MLLNSLRWAAQHFNARLFGAYAQLGQRHSVASSTVLPVLITSRMEISS